MIVHTLLYKFPDTVDEAQRNEFFAAMRDVVMGSGLVDAFDLKPHLWLPADRGARGMTAATIVQFTTDDLTALEKFSELPEVFDFITDWKSRVNFEAAYANHEPLTV
jgi:aromatase